MFNETPDPLIVEFAGKDNWFNYGQFYDWIVRENDFKTFVEVGVWKGKSISHLASALVAKQGTDFELYGVDWWDKLPKDSALWESHGEQIPALYEMYNYNLRKAGVRGHVFDLVGDSANMATFFKDGTVDFVYIDASHDYDSVCADIRAWLPKVRKNGIIGGHDLTHPDVKRALETCLDRVNYYPHNADVWFTRIR